jgi:phenylpropionate dioxygenase-like ring-hydroxylating dioxygenase large terminal subunit
MTATDRFSGGNSGGRTVQELLDQEVSPVPPVLRRQSMVDLGIDDIDRQRYVGAEWHALEVTRLWNRVWQVACREEEIPRVGDTSVYEIADASLIVVRTATGTVKAFHNSCLHRGRQLVTRDGSISELRCPFHGFTWSLDGELLRVPCSWDFPQVVKEEYCLPQARVECWGGWVFVNLDPEAGPLHDYLGDFVGHWSAWSTEERTKTLHIVKQLPCNWKVGLEAFLESFHVANTHPQLLVNIGDTNTEYDVYEGQPHFNRMISAQAVPSPHLGMDVNEQEILDSLMNGGRAAAPRIILGPGETARRALADAVRGQLARSTRREISCSDSEAIDAIQYFVFPNFVPWGGYAPIVYRFRPNRNDQCSSIMDMMLLAPFPADERPAPAKPQLLGLDDDWSSVPELGRLGRIFDQDMSNLGPVQRGLQASVKAGVTLARYQESRIRHYLQSLDDYIETPTGPWNAVTHLTSGAADGFR